MIAMKVVAKNVKKPEAKASRRLWNRLNPSSGKPRNLPPPGTLCAECCIAWSDPSRLE
jgi:hypothetical protein